MGDLFRQEEKDLAIDYTRYGVLKGQKAQSSLTGDELEEWKELNLSINVKMSLQKAVKWVESAKAVDAISKLASADRRIQAHSTEFDANPELINCINGVVNLRTKELLPHDRKLMLTSLCPTEYSPNATCPQFEKAIVDYARCGDNEQPELLEFKHRFFGYCVTGYITEKIIPVVHGTADTGKSSELRCIKETLGPDYQWVISLTPIIPQR
jgi:phage/plasmid-associated DNA primase